MAGDESNHSGPKDASKEPGLGFKRHREPSWVLELGDEKVLGRATPAIKGRWDCTAMKGAVVGGDMVPCLCDSQKSHIMAERNVLLKNVQHPFLVGLRYSFQTPEKLYFVLDYVNGGEVSRLAGRLPWAGCWLGGIHPTCP